MIFVLAVYLIFQNSFIIAQRKQVAIAEEKTFMLMENYNILMNNYNNNQIFYHDLKNQYVVIREYLHSKEY